MKVEISVVKVSFIYVPCNDATKCCIYHFGWWKLRAFLAVAYLLISAISCAINWNESD